MQASEAILIVLLVVLILVVAYRGYSYAQSKKGGGEVAPGEGGAPSPEPFAGAPAKEGMEGRPSVMSLDQAQRQAWLEATCPGAAGASFDPSLECGAADALAQHHTPSPGINYQEALIDTVADGRMRAQHDNWHAEVAPMSQTSGTVDNLDEAVAMSLPRQGILAFRFSAPTQYNPRQITDLDASSFRQHATKFSFGG